MIRPIFIKLNLESKNPPNSVNFKNQTTPINIGYITIVFFKFDYLESRFMVHIIEIITGSELIGTCNNIS